MEFMAGIRLSTRTPDEDKLKDGNRTCMFRKGVDKD
jgi:hypothetical protein